MTFNPLAGMVVASLVRELPPDPVVMELGNQRFTVTDEILGGILRDLDGRPGVDAAALRSWIGLDKDKKMPLTESFYKALGFKSYASIDVNTKYGSLMMDLNKDIRQTYGYAETFDLVTNNGTGEHIFNQYMVFKNIHDLAKPGGLMLHIMPFVNWVNHGFYNFHPLLYADLATSNGYELIKLSFANRWGFEVPVRLENRRKNKSVPAGKLAKALGLLRRILKKPVTVPPKEIYMSDSFVEVKPKTSRGPLALALESLASKDFPNVNVVVVLRKRFSAPFVAPLQGKYVGDVQNLAIKKEYAQQTQ